MFDRIDHVGVAVDDMEQAVALYRDALGMREEHRETVDSFGVEAVLLEVGDGHVELLRGLDESSGVARFVRERGPGVHHVAYRTEDIEGALRRVREAGLRLVDETPRAGIRGSRVAFLHPGATGGVLTELVEPAAS